ncbi:YndM family protein [Heyndrickxia sp. NPDC080065]|uniref:YndM family protein n=1 Tax=Heyndrickxia sp. NPDC080065 TaxID=3390568 RepID=UPI003D05AC0E
MKHLKPMVIKFIATFIMLFVILNLFFGMSFAKVVFISLSLTIISYSFGDVEILPRTNNTIASLADFGLSLVTIWFLSAAVTYFNRSPLFISSLISAAAITIFEYFFHKYMLSFFQKQTDRVLPRPRPLPANFQTETSEEIRPKIEKNHENK